VRAVRKTDSAAIRAVRILLFAALLCGVGHLFAIGLQNHVFLSIATELGSGGGGSGDPCTGCTNETFEGTGTSVAGWKYGDNSSGVITNVDYTTAPAPLNGSQSLLIRNPDSQAGTLNLVIPSSAQVDLRWMMVLTNTIVNNTRLIKLDDNVGAAMFEVQVQATSLRVVHGTANATTVSDLAINTLYYCWAQYVKGSGANGVGSVRFSTSKVKPSSGDGVASLTTGSSVNNATDFYFIVNSVSFGSEISGVIFDDLSISVGGSIGDFP